MTVGEARNERRKELITILTDVLTLLEDGGVLDRPYELDAVSASLYFAQPIANRLAQKPVPMDRTPLTTWGIPVLPAPGYTGPPLFTNGDGAFHVFED